jgi:hypothetical protein
MRKTVTILSLTTALFATSTLYLAYRLYWTTAPHQGAAAEQPAAEPAPVPSVGALDPEARAAAPGAASTPGPAMPAAAASGVPAAAASVTEADAQTDRERAALKGFAQQWLEKFDDSTQRATLLEEHRLRLRRQYSALKDKLKMDSATFDQLLTLLAEQQLVPQERYFRCVVNPACDLKEFQKRGNPTDDRASEINALLGENLDEFNKYRDTIGDRDAVALLRGRLGETNALRDEQAEKLIAALNDERAKFQDEAAQSGATLNGWGTELGMLWFQGDSNSLDQRFADAAAYSQRLRDRAATVLSPQQLAVFVQMQDELLAMMRSHMRPPR